MASCSDDNDGNIIISRTEAFSSKLGEELMMMQDEDDFTDFSLRTGDRVVECHRVIIAAVSPVLKAMLKSKMKEFTEKQIQLDNISPQIMDILIKYIYCGETRISKEILRDVVEAADFLQMDDLKQMCVEQATPLIHPKNVISWFKFSGRLNLPGLLSHCSNIMTSQLYEIRSFNFIKLDLIIRFITITK